MLTKRLFVLGVIALHLLLGFVQVVGQQPTKPIALGKLETGNITHDVPVFSYGFTARENQSIEIEVLVADGDLTPQISLLQDAAVLQAWDALPGEATLKAKFTFQTAGQYVIAISSADEHASGIFVLTIHEAQAAALTQVSFDTPVSDAISRSETLRYIIQADAAAATIIAININNLTQSVSARLKNADDKAIGVIGQDLQGGGFRVPAGTEQYVLEVSNSNLGSVPIDFTILLSRSTR